jgi:hypothetical protein
MSNATLFNLSALIEQPESRRRENGDSQAETRIYVASYTVCLAAQKVKGTAGTDDLLGYVIRSSTVEPIRGLAARLVDVWVAGGDDADPETIALPPDEFSLQSQDLNPPLEKNAFFSMAAASTTRYNAAGATGTTSAHKTLIAWVRQAGVLADETETNVAWNALIKFVTDNPSDQAMAEALVLADLLRKGTSNYYRASFVYSWTQYSYTLPTFSVGGSVETPGGPLASAISGLSLSCLRQADNLAWDGSRYSLTKSWLCGPDGQWDADLYP